MHTNRTVFELAGRVSDSSKIVEFLIDGTAASLQADGSFHFTRAAAVGESEMVITALDEWGNSAERRVQVTRSAPAKALEAALVIEEEPQTATLGQRTDDGAAPRIQLPPKLVTDSKNIEISGSVWDQSAIVDLFANERRFKLRPDGSFRIHGSLKIGVNKFTFVAVDEWGNRTTKRIDVERKQLDLAFGEYNALVIGNNDYNDMPILQTAIADAEAVSDILQSRYGFKVTKLINATR